MVMITIRDDLYLLNMRQSNMITVSVWFSVVNLTNVFVKLFCTTVFCAAFMCLQLGFVIFLAKEKLAQKLFIKCL